MSEASADQVLRLRTRDDAAIRGHALLIGVPLDGLGGVDQCLMQLRGWLEPEYGVVERWEGATKLAIERAMQDLHDDVRHGDQVLVYYVGHGLQELTRSDGHDHPAWALTTMDARRCELSPEQRLFPADELVDWVRTLAKASGSDRPTSGRAGSRRPSVTIIVDSCRCAALLDAWPEDQERRLSLLAKMAAPYDESITRTAVTRTAEARARGVLWVLAAGRAEVAHGPASGQAGLFTRALTKVLREHPGEPWWAVMDRLRAAWAHPMQSPALSGPAELVPRAGFAVERPTGWLPCKRVGSQRWRVEMAAAAGWCADERVRLSSSLVLPAFAEGRVEPRDGGDLAVHVLADDTKGAEDPEGSNGPDFAWACRRELAQASQIEVWGGTAEARAQVLEAWGHQGRNLGDAPRDGPERAPVGLALDEHGVTVRDGWGDPLERTPLDGLATWLHWTERLAQLEGWLAVERTAPRWRDGAFELRWGTWNAAGEPSPWSDEPPVVTPQTPLWIELEDLEPGWPAYAGLFRVCADRSIEVLSQHAANGGFSLTRGKPVVDLGEKHQPVRLSWPASMGTDLERWEELVAIVSNRPLTFLLLGMEGKPVARGLEGGKRMRGDRQPVKLAMLRRRYRLRPG